MLRILCFVFMGLFISPIIQGSEKVDLFPELKGWELKVRDKVYEPDNLWDIINGAADSYLSYDFEKLYVADYTNSQDHHIKVYAFRHSSPVNAFGIYSQERSLDYEFLDIGTQGFESSGALYFIKGNYYIQIKTNDKPAYGQLKALAKKIDQELKEPSQLPEVLDLFPEKGKVPYSEKYIARNFLGYSYLHSAFIADYKKGDDHFRVFVIATDAQEDRNEMLSAYLDYLEYPNENRDKVSYDLTDPYLGPVSIYQSEHYLVGVLNAPETLREEYLALLKSRITHE